MPLGNPPPPLTPPEVVKIDVDSTAPCIGTARRFPTRDALEQMLAAAAAQQVQPELHLRPDKNSRYEIVAGVMASAQRLGLTKIGIVGSEQFIDE